MSDDLIKSLLALAAGRHDDLSIAVDAVIEIRRQCAEIERLRADLALEQSLKVLQRGEIEKLRAEIERLREALTSIRIDGPRADGLVWVAFHHPVVAGQSYDALAGDMNRLVSQALLQFEEIRRNALEGKP